LFALLLFCIVFKVRTGLADAFEAARATSFVILSQFQPCVNPFSFVFGLFSRLFRKTNEYT